MLRAYASFTSELPTTPGEFQQGNAGGFNDAYILKMNPTGSGLIYSTFLGGGNDQSGYGDDKAFALAVDLAGNAYVAGTTSCTDFPTTPDAFDITFSGGLYDAFVTKLNPQGNDLSYSTYLGGVNNSTQRHRIQHRRRSVCDRLNQFFQLPNHSGRRLTRRTTARALTATFSPVMPL